MTRDSRILAIGVMIMAVLCAYEQEAAAWVIGAILTAFECRRRFLR